MKTNKFYLIAALLGTALVGCQKEAEIQTPAEQQDVAKTWTLTVKAAKSPQTRALTLDGKTLNAEWKEGEVVAVYDGGVVLGTLSVAEVDEAGIATLTGTISLGDISTLTLIYPGRTDQKWTYLGQGGDAPSLDGALNQFDYATATVDVESLTIENETSVAVATDVVTFNNEQSIYCFGFKVSGAALTAKSFLLSSSEGKLVRSRSFGSSDWESEKGIITVNPVSGSEYYMALRNENTSANDTYTFNVVGGDDALYSGTKNIPGSVLEMGQYLAARNIAVTKKAFTPQTEEITQEADVL